MGKAYGNTVLDENQFKNYLERFFCKEVVLFFLYKIIAVSRTCTLGWLTSGDDHPFANPIFFFFFFFFFFNFEVLLQGQLAGARCAVCDLARNPPGDK